MDAWTAYDVLRFLDARGASIIIRKGETLLDFPQTYDRERDLRTILPHLKARKAEIIEILEADSKPHLFQLARPHMFASDPVTGFVGQVDPFAPKSDADADFERDFVQAEQLRIAHASIQDRNRMLRNLASEAAKLGKTLWLLNRRSGSVVAYEVAKKKVKRRKVAKTWKAKPIPPEKSANFACIDGAKEWTRLPKVTTVEEDIRIEPPRRRKAGKGD